MADTLIKQGSWQPLPINVEGYPIRIIAEHYKITKIEIFLKKVTDTAFPTTATITILPSDLGMTKYFTTNTIFERPGNRVFHWIKVNWYGDTIDGCLNYIRNEDITTEIRRGR